VKTPASFWPLLAGACSPEQAKRLAMHADDPLCLGGEFPFPSVSRDSIHFETKGLYWRGGIWLPTAYMAIKSLERNGHAVLADELAERIVRQQYLTWRDFEPHTIWEAYSPVAPLPSGAGKCQHKGVVRPDFCGWSALGPICLMIENVIGLRINAIENLVEWRIHHRKAHGVKKLHFGKIEASLLYAGNGELEVVCNNAFTLKIENDLHGDSYTNVFPISPGKTRLSI
jgi:hypothetical protein